MSDKIQRYSLTEHGSLIEDDNGSWCFASVVDQQDAELERYRAALRAIIERSHNDPLGTSKVVDMRRIAEQAIGEKP